MWKICVEEPFMNCQKIYPIQQKKVKSLLQKGFSLYMTFGQTIP